MKTLVARLTRYRWCLSAMAELWRSEGAKFVTLVRKLGSSDKAMRQALDYLMQEGLVMRNPGYGHPWRPEYILTESGRAIGRTAADLLTELGDASQDLALDRWCLPIVSILSDSPRRHSEIKRMAEAITPRSLTLALSELAESGLLERSVSTGSPPAVTYSLTPRGAGVARVLADLAPQRG